MTNPILVEVLRGSLVESRHRGAVAVADSDGGAVLAVGDVTTPIFPRSAVKALQALPLVETGAADAFGFGDEELALACASHSGEPGHVAGVTRMLAKAGLDASALRCGAHWPMAQSAVAALARTGEPSALHNNCSGKHAGFLCVACAKGIDHADYWRPQHPVQGQVRAVLENLTGTVLGDDRCAIDGCSVPTWAIPLENLARAFAKFATGHGLAPERARAIARVLRAKTVARRRHRAVLHRDHAAVRRAGVREDRRRRRLLRRAARTRPRHSAQMRRWRRPRGAGCHGGDHRAVSAPRRCRARGASAVRAPDTAQLERL